MAGPTQQQKPGAAAPAKSTRRIKVRATREGYYDLSLRRVDDVFTVEESAFSETWMERVHANTAERNTGSQAEINRRNEEVRGGGSERGGTGDVEVI